MAIPPTPAEGTAVEDHVPKGFPQPEPDDMTPRTQHTQEIEVDVDFNAPNLDFDQKEDNKQPGSSGAEQDDRDVLDIIEPKADPRVWEFGPEFDRREYVQKPLSFIGKMKWFSLIGDALDKALTGDNAISLNSLFDTPGGRRPGELSATDFRDADTFVQAVGKLLAVAPNFLVDSYCIWLGVPDYDRKIVAEMMEASPEEGGLSDEMGMEIIETFLDQNYEALASFFGERIGRLQRRVEALNKVRKARASQRSKH